MLSGRGLLIDHSSRGVLLSVVCLRQGLQEATLHATGQRVQLPPTERAESKIAMPVTCKSEKTRQSVSSTLVHHSTSQR